MATQIKTLQEQLEKEKRKSYVLEKNFSIEKTKMEENFREQRKVRQVIEAPKSVSQFYVDSMEQLLESTKKDHEKTVKQLTAQINHSKISAHDVFKAIKLIIEEWIRKKYIMEMKKILKIED